MVTTSSPDQEHGPWNPGIRSELPAEYLGLSTMFRRENVSTSLRQAREMADFCGLSPFALVAFRPERLIVHELLIRVTADLSVPDGPNDEDLGISFRKMAATILDRHVEPHGSALAQRFADVAEAAAAVIDYELSRELFATGHTNAVAPATGWRSWLSRRDRQKRPAADPAARERAALDRWQRMSQDAARPLHSACCDALIEVVSAVIKRRGRLLGDKELIAGLALAMVCNGHGSEVIGDALDPILRAAVVGQGYRFLPPQKQPVVMNVKGASASGKSSMRRLQRSLAERLGIPWDDFAVISPDIWRKLLLDYDALGKAYKYAGTMTGHELEIIDRKLDRYMAAKAGRGEMSHLLIDRFRFDSFAPESEDREPSKLLTRFGHLIYMYFMITPPEATVERAWKRGQRVGRYKAVDDLLDHNVEAYTGMPQLFFTWALRTRKRVHYEFLDNSVDQGHLPRTVAFGWNGEMNILDLKCMIDVDRFRKVNIDAATPNEVYSEDDLSPAKNTGFLRQCARLIPVINLADFETGEIYARLEKSRWVWRDEEYISGQCQNDDARAGLDALGTAPDEEAAMTDTAPLPLDASSGDTLGAWGRDVRRPSG